MGEKYTLVSSGRLNEVRDQTLTKSPPVNCTSMTSSSDNLLQKQPDDWNKFSM